MDNKIATLQSKEQAWAGIKHHHVNQALRWVDSQGRLWSLKNMSVNYIFNCLQLYGGNFINELINRNFDKEKLRSFLQQNLDKL